MICVVVIHGYTVRDAGVYTEQNLDAARVIMIVFAC